MKQTYCRKQKKLRKHAWNPQKQEDVTFKKKKQNRSEQSSLKSEIQAKGCLMT